MQITANDTPLPRWYVTMTWDDWPAGGSYGTVVHAFDYDGAVAMAKAEMAAACVEGDYETPEQADAAIARLLTTLGDEWFVVDCFKLDDFLDNHAPLRVSMDVCTRKAEPLRLTESVSKVEFPDHTAIEILRSYPVGVTLVLRGAKLVGTVELRPLLEACVLQLKQAEAAEQTTN